MPTVEGSTEAAQHRRHIGARVETTHERTLHLEKVLPLFGPGLAGDDRDEVVLRRLVGVLGKRREDDRPIVPITGEEDLKE